jgi:hypothetical protein
MRNFLAGVITNQRFPDSPKKILVKKRTLVPDPGRLPSGLTFFLIVLDHAKLGSLAAEKDEAIEPYLFELRRLANDSRWLRFALSRPGCGVGRVLPRRCAADQAVLRPDNIAPVLTIVGKERPHCPDILILR